VAVVPPVVVRARLVVELAPAAERFTSHLRVGSAGQRTNPSTVRVPVTARALAMSTVPVLLPIVSVLAPIEEKRDTVPAPVTSILPLVVRSGAVRVLLVSVSVEVRATIVSVADGRVRVIVEAVGPDRANFVFDEESEVFSRVRLPSWRVAMVESSSVLLTRVSVLCLPTSVSVALGAVRVPLLLKEKVPAPLTRLV